LAPTPTSTWGTTIATTALGGDVSRVMDRDAGVVCWVFWAAGRGGISCLPLKDTALDGGK
jgi:hypothetical protein